MGRPSTQSQDRGRWRDKRRLREVELEWSPKEIKHPGEEEGICKSCSSCTYFSGLPAGCQQEGRRRSFLRGGRFARTGSSYEGHLLSQCSALLWNPCAFPGSVPSSVFSQDHQTLWLAKNRFGCKEQADQDHRPGSSQWVVQLRFSWRPSVG